jgi:hypothetical protein
MTGLSGPDDEGGCPLSLNKTIHQTKGNKPQCNSHFETAGTINLHILEVINAEEIHRDSFRVGPRITWIG